MENSFMTQLDGQLLGFLPLVAIHLWLEESQSFVPWTQPPGRLPVLMQRAGHQMAFRQEVWRQFRAIRLLRMATAEGARSEPLLAQ
jgi:hypothetical protein